MSLMVVERKTRMPRDERERRVLDVAGELFSRRGPHEVGMDELIARTGLGKATVYRLYPSKDRLIAAYLASLSSTMLAAIDRDAAAATPTAALHAVIDAVAADLGRAGFRGCPFNNASIEYADPAHPARLEARNYRRDLADRLVALAAQVTGGADSGQVLGNQLAVLVDGAYTNAAHLGVEGPARAGLDLAHQLIAAATVAE